MLPFRMDAFERKPYCSRMQYVKPSINFLMICVFVVVVVVVVGNAQYRADIKAKINRAR